MLFSHFSQQVSSSISSESTLVVALSGGVDSVVLLHLAAHYSQQHQHSCCAVHVNHGLSPHAEKWEQSCQHYCEQLGIPLFIERVTLEVGASQSIEDVARKARYQVLGSYVKPDGVLLTGHHQDDQVETFLLALKRGSGPAGLAAMPMISPFSLGTKCRPLLSVSRGDIEAYAKENQLHWVEDESNKNMRFDRNFLRHKITPLLSQRWPSFSAAVSRSAQLCAEQEQLLIELLSPRIKCLQNEAMGLSIQGLNLESAAARNVLLRLWFTSFAHYAPSQAQLSVLWDEVAQAKEDANPCLSIHSMQIRRFQGYLYCLPQYQDLTQWKAELMIDKPLRLPDKLGVLELQKSLSLSENDHVVVQTLRGPLKEEKVQVQFDGSGLVAQPEMRSHRRKLKKLYQEYGIPSWQRKRFPLVFYNDTLVAVAGLFICKAFSGNEYQLLWVKNK